jgi:hypothetical protein
MVERNKELAIGGRRDLALEKVSDIFGAFSLNVHRLGAFFEICGKQCHFFLCFVVGM